MEIVNTNRCVVCSEPMFPIKRFTTGTGKKVRMKCTCGHYDDIPDVSDKPSINDYEESGIKFEENK